MNIKCQTCKALVSESYEFIECPACGAYAWEHDQIGQVQLYNPESNRKAYRPIPYSPKQLKMELKKYKVKASQMYQAFGKERDEFSRWLNEEKEIPQYIQAAFWMYFELVRLNQTLKKYQMKPNRNIPLAQNTDQRLEIIAGRLGKTPEELASDIIAKVVHEPRSYFVCCPQCQVEMFDAETISVSGIMSGECTNGHAYEYDCDTGEFV